MTHQTTKSENGQNFGRPRFAPHGYHYNRVHRTHLIATSTAQRIDEIAENQNVGKSDLVNFLLTSAIRQLESGELVLRKKSVLERIDFVPQS